MKSVKPLPVKKILSVAGVMLLLALTPYLLMKIGQASETYSAASIDAVNHHIASQWNAIHKHFDSPDNLDEAIVAVMLKPEYTVLDMLVLGKDTIKEQWHVEFGNLGLVPAKHLLHVHQHQDGRRQYVVGGFTLNGFEVNTKQVPGIFYTGMTYPVIQRLELQIDKRLPEDARADGSGWFKWAKRQDYGAVYDAGFYFEGKAKSS